MGRGEVEPKLSGDAEGGDVEVTLVHKALAWLVIATLCTSGVVGGLLLIFTATSVHPAYTKETCSGPANVTLASTATTSDICFGVPPPGLLTPNKTALVQLKQGTLWLRPPCAFSLPSGWLAVFKHRGCPEASFSELIGVHPLVDYPLVNSGAPVDIHLENLRAAWSREEFTCWTTTALSPCPFHRAVVLDPPRHEDEPRMVLGVALLLFGGGLLLVFLFPPVTPIITAHAAGLVACLLAPLLAPPPPPPPEPDIQSPLSPPCSPTPPRPPLPPPPPKTPLFSEIPLEVVEVAKKESTSSVSVRSILLRSAKSSSVHSSCLSSDPSSSPKSMPSVPSVTSPSLQTLPRRKPSRVRSRSCRSPPSAFDSYVNPSASSRDCPAMRPRSVSSDPKVKVVQPSE
eukprot:Sspe_Gene.81671::Locus_52646_Transcript_1_1_Confidence_1.000_Length_1276::g.81671::m.81671